MAHHSDMTRRDPLTIRPGTDADADTVLRLLDSATTWLADQGRTGQWGSAPASTDPHRIEQAHRYAASGGLWLARLDGQPVGALVVGQATAYVPPADEPELYVNLLVTDRAYAGRGIGGRLLAYAEELARDAGVALLRVDCYAGDDGALMRYYQRQGFTPTAPFTVERPGRPPWPGQVLARRLDRPPDTLR